MKDLGKVTSSRMMFGDQVDIISRVCLSGSFDEEVLGYENI